MTVFKIETIDRIGITHDVVECLAHQQIDILRMEVLPHYIYLRVTELAHDQLPLLAETIQKIVGVKQVAKIRNLPSEEREIQIRTILSTVSEGIISTDEKLVVQTINPAAANMLAINGARLIHQPLEVVWGEAIAEVRNCLEEGAVVSHFTLTLPILKHGMTKFVCCYQPILSHKDNMVKGIVIVIRDMKQIQDIIETMKQPGSFHFDELIYDGNPLRTCIETAKRVSRSQATILLEGESGTGKELFAKAIHYESERSNRPYVPVNCAAIPETLLESELFGYEEGAFTGARKGGHPGLFEVAQTGTLFLDEIGEIPLHLQAKLLRVLEERTIRRIGGSKNIPIDVRIIAATNRNLPEMVANGMFREDLFYRLHVIPIRIPPLRERKHDIPLLATYFIEKVCRQIHRPTPQIQTAALNYLQSHDWPGNVRELQNVIERAVYLNAGQELQVEHLHIASRFPTNHPAYLSSQPISLKQQVDQFERNVLVEVVRSSPSIRRAAAKLGLSHTALLNKLKKYGIKG